MFKNILKRTALILFIIAVLSLAGCSLMQSTSVNQASKSYTPPFATSSAPAFAPSAAMPPAPAPSMAGDYSAGGSYGSIAVVNNTDQAADRKIVRTGSATLEGSRYRQNAGLDLRVGRPI
ncbi:MAG: hypothetical protein ABSG90_12010 [Dehalococcoidia bacterium]|jgi:hypothetical protein